MTRAVLLPIAIAATLADSAAFVLLIGSGAAVERNPLVAQMSEPVALWAKAALIVTLASLTVLSSLVASRALRFTVGVALVVAIVAGGIGFASTVAA